MKAIWNDIVLAESDDTEVVEDNHYFPPSAVNREHVAESDHQTTCPWKGEASYYDLVANSGDSAERAENAAWYYPDPKEAASQIKDYVAFYPDRVEITE